MKTKVLIAEDHPFTRIGLRSILESNDTLQIVGEAVDGIEAVKMVSELQPDVVIMDISMPNLTGIEATHAILKEHPEVKIIALSIHSGQEFVKKMLKAGAVGYLLKDEAPEELLKALEKVIGGDMFLGASVTRTALKNDERASQSPRINTYASKMHRPPILPEYLQRSRLINILEENSLKPLSLISAGAGYGKSIVASQWLEQTKHLYTWISLDQEHNDFRTFLAYLIAAVEKLFPGSMKSTQELVYANMLPPLKDISRTIINELCDIDQDFILVLDDYQLIKESNVHELFNDLIRFPPPCLHLCILTRRDPPLDIKPLRLAGRMTEIRMDTLSFTSIEIAEFFNELLELKLDDESIHQLYQKTEGWILALKLIAMLKKDSVEIKELLESAGVGLHTISEYLLEEVLLNQPPHIQDELIESSILDRFCEPLLKEVISGTEKNATIGLDSAAFINWLAKFNLFIIPLDNDQSWFRYHHLFQDFLQGQFKKNGTLEQQKKLHVRASHWFENNNFIDDAIGHAIKAADNKRAVRIIVENWELECDSDNSSMVGKWLNNLPKRVIESSISLLFASFFWNFKAHRLIELAEVAGLILQSKKKLSDTEKGYRAFINSIFSYFAGDGKKTIDEAEIAIKLIPEQYASFRGDARTYWFLGMLMAGKPDKALAAHKMNTTKFLELEEPVQLGRLRTNMGFYALINANVPQLKTAIKEISKTDFFSNFMLGFYRSNYVYMSWACNDMEGVIRECDEVIQVKYEYTSRLVIDCYVMKALALQESNKPELAMSTMNEAIEYATYTKDAVNLNVALSGQARLALQNGEVKAAYDWLDTTDDTEIDSSILWCTEVQELTRCRVLINRGEQKDLEKALELLTRYSAYSKSIYNKVQSVHCIVLQTLAYKKLGQKKEAYNTLKSAIELAAEGEWIRPFTEHYGELSSLLQLLHEKAVQPGFITMIASSLENIEESSDKLSADKRAKNRSRDKTNALTQSELKILHYVAEGLRNQEIAEKLFNSEETIKKHIYHMFQKLEVKNRLSLVTKAREKGIID